MSEIKHLSPAQRFNQEAAAVDKSNREAASRLPMVINWLDMTRRSAVSLPVLIYRDPVGALATAGEGAIKVPSLIVEGARRAIGLPSN